MRAPEQLRGEPLDVRADIYAVGATLYYLLTGQPPFEARDLRELVERVNTEPPKSPRALRPDIPSGLAAVVLRCLSKSPSQRPESYPALAELLRPFSAIGESPASPRLRVLAAVVDIVILTLPFSIWDAATADVVINGQSNAAPTSPWRWLLNAVYFFALEARWGASWGKQLFGLQLSSPGSAGWVMRVARRTIVFHIPWLVIALLLLWVGPIGPASDFRVGANFNFTLKARDTRGLIESAMTLTLVAALFLTARRHNGWAGLHDLAGATRVVSRSAARLRSRRAAPAAALLDAAPAARGRRYGPFIATGDAGDDDPHLVAAFDPVLRRRVWIHIVPPYTRPIDEVRRDLSRTGRLHWLTGRRNGSDNWDAFEAPDGQSLLTALHDGVPPWGTLKSWLLDLSGELVAAARDGSMPALRLDRLWIRDDGRLVLLDFPAPRPSSGQAPGVDRDEAARTFADLSPVQLLSAIAERSTPAASGSSALMPLSARTLLQSWSRQQHPSLSDAHAELVHVAAGLDRVTRARRALPIVLASIPPVFLVAFTLLLMLPTMNRFFSPDATEMLDMLEMLYQPNPRSGSRLVDPSVRQAMETYVAGKHSARLRDPRFWNSPVIQQGVGKRLQPTADGVAARHPLSRQRNWRAPRRPSRPRSKRLRQRRGREDFSSVSGTMVLISTAGSLLPMLLLSIVSALIVPGGLFTRMLGHAVVTRRGTEIGRAISLARVLVAWAPAIAWLLYLASSPRVQGFVPTPPSPMLGALVTLAALGVGAIYTIVRPERGPHDWLLGTWVVPR